MILKLEQKATPEQMRLMCEEYQTMIKIAVDLRRKILAAGGEMHADCEQILLNEGSEQEDIWGANWYPEEQRIEFEALINIRPLQGNRGMIIESEPIRQAIEKIAFAILGDVQ